MDDAMAAAKGGWVSGPASFRHHDQVHLRGPFFESMSKCAPGLGDPLEALPRGTPALSALRTWAALVCLVR